MNVIYLNFKHLIKYFKIYCRCRISPFIIGILLGYLIFLNKKQTNKNIPLSETTSKGIYEKCINIIFLMLAFILCGLALFGPHGDFVGYPLNPTANLLYQSTSKTLWTIGVAYIIFACLTSRARIINSFLSWWVWIPLARLSFGAFLVHIPLIF
jgi:peptidoglycan/LPS O-acetylase OafA/YrhL